MSRHNIAVDCGFCNREWACDQMVQGGTVRIGQRLQPYVGVNVTWITHPGFEFLGNNAPVVAQISYASADEKRLLRVIKKWGWKIINYDRPIGQCGVEEVNGSGLVTEFQDSNETIKDWGYNVRR